MTDGARTQIIYCLSMHDGEGEGEGEKRRAMGVVWACVGEDERGLLQVPRQLRHPPCSGPTIQPFVNSLPISSSLSFSPGNR